MKKFLIFIASIFVSSYIFAQRPIVRDIQALAGKGTIINVNWTLPESPDEKINNLYVYRSTRLISSADDLQNLTPIVTLEGWITHYQDKISDFKDYYYAVIAETSKAYEIIIVGVNSTASGVHLTPKKSQKKNTPKKAEEKIYSDGQLRETPLPFVSFVDGMNKNDLISDETADSTRSLSFTKVKEDSLLRPYIFEEDLVSPDGGDDFLLFEILKTSFAPQKYSDAIRQLERLLGTNISEKTRNRAYFYIGESYYFLGEYATAVRNFIKVETVFPTQAKKWIDSSLDQI